MAVVDELPLLKVMFATTVFHFTEEFVAEENIDEDIMVKEEDAGRINRIVEKFKLATVDTLTIESEITKSLESKKEVSKGKLNPKKALTVKDRLSELLLGNKKVDSTKKKESVKKKLEVAKKED